MESPSSKIPELFQNIRKLKQATLPFETVKVNSKHEPTLFKRQKTDCDTGKLSVDTENVEIIEVFDSRCIEGGRNCNKNETKNDVPQGACKVQIMGKNICKDDLKVNETEINIEKDRSPSSMEPSKEIETQFISDKVVYENNSEINLCNSKRKLETTEQIKGQKPPKRAKLIYHVDKLKKHDGEIGGSKMETNLIQSVNTDCVNNIDVEPNEGVCEKDLKSNLLHGVSEEDSDLQDKCNKDSVLGSSIMQEVNVLDTDISDIDCATPISEENSVSSRNSSVKKLTPKQLEKKAELRKRKENLQQEKERKKKEKEEEKVRMKQAKAEFRKKLKEEKQKKRQAKIELKSEEKRRKEEQRRKREEQKLEDKRRKEEQKLEDKRKREEIIRKKEEEEELIKKKITKEAEAFSSFFKKYDVKTPATREDSSSCTEIIFMPFTVKADMRLAPINRNPMDPVRRSKFEELYNAQSEIVTYLQELCSGIRVPERKGNTWPLEEKYDGDVVILDEGLNLENEVTAVPKRKFSDRKPKLLQFYENRRPPYWGTWRKKSKTVRPKNPLGKDQMFEYEVDSDDEWEEEEPGESLHGSDDEKESEDEYEVDNEFFVPHGYLSDDENPEEEIISPETQKLKLKLLGEQFDMERNEKTKLLKPITLGCIWFKSQSDEPDCVNPSVVKFLNKRKAVPWTDSIPILLPDENPDSNEAATTDNDTPTNKKASFPVAVIRDLITFIHGSTDTRKNLSKMFLVQWTKREEDKITENEENAFSLSQARVTRKIKELAKWEEFPEEGPCYGKRCWYVKKDIREKFGVTNLVVNNEGEVSEGKEVDGSKKLSPCLITKYTKVLTEDGKMNQMMKYNNRKSVFTPNSSTEKSSTSPKSQYNKLGCVRKLTEFWAKPNFSEKCSEGVSMPSKRMDKDVVPVSQPHEENHGVVLMN